MAKIEVNSFEEFEVYVGKEIGVSEYHKITQDQINIFADATLDHQWIHVNPEKAKKESPFGDTIAHGYLTLSILQHLWVQIMQVNNTTMMINYGIEKLKFREPVMVNDEVRLKTHLSSLRNLRGTVKAEINASHEIKGKDKPAFTGIVVFLYHFKK